MEEPEYARLRDELLEFLEVRAYTLNGQTPPVRSAPLASRAAAGTTTDGIAPSSAPATAPLAVVA